MPITPAQESIRKKSDLQDSLGYRVNPVSKTQMLMSKVLFISIPGMMNNTGFLFKKILLQLIETNSLKYRKVPEYLNRVS